MEGNATKAIFKIRLTGDGVQPEKLAAGDLAQLLLAAEQTVLSVARDENPDEADDILISLSALKSESVGLVFSSNQPETIRGAFSKVVELVRSNNYDALPAQSLEGLRTITRFTSDRNGNTQFWNGDDKGPLLNLGPGFALTIPKPSYSRGETVIYGKIERAGGVKPRIKLRVSPKTVVYGDVNEEQARDLGASLYKTVALRGRATWDIRTGRIVYFRVAEILSHQPGNVREAFAALRESTKGAYEKVEDIDLLAFQIREGEVP